MVILVPMTSHEADSFLRKSVVDFATDLAASTSMLQDEALQWARAKLEEILPERQNTFGHEFDWIIHDGHRVGGVWFASSLTEEGTLFIWDIFVDPEHQHRGFGGAALDAIAALARERELSGVALSVFVSNPDARRLYERKGFVAENPNEGSVRMRLDLR
jgi:ribosomal protein S18 acetylase RimI-like enzyme